MNDGPTIVCIDSCRSGHDVKSLLLNLWSITVFLMPFALFFLQDNDHRLIYTGVTVTSTLLALGYPPMGWKRPHPYSDQPENTLKTPGKTTKSS